MKQMSELSESERWAQLQRESAIKQQFAARRRQAQEEAEDGCLWPLAQLKQQLAQAVAASRRQHGIA